MFVALDAIALHWPLILAVVRAGSFVAILPTFGVVGPGMRPRIILSVVLGLAITVSQKTVAGTADPVAWPAQFIVELASGFALGFTIRVMFAAVQIAAHMSERQFGLPVFDSGDEEPGSVTHRLYQLVNVAVFLCLSGHRWIVVALLHVGELDGMGVDAADWTSLAVRILSASWYLAAQAALPMVISLLTAQLAAGMTARFLPQLGGAAVTVPIHVLAGLMLLLISLATVAVSFSRGIDWAMRSLNGP